MTREFWLGYVEKYACHVRRLGEPKRVQSSEDLTEIIPLRLPTLPVR